MKRCCVMLMVVAVLLGGPLVAHGADYGFEIGMNRATQDFDCDGPYKYETDSRPGFRAGVFAEFGLTDRLYIDAGLHYVAMGMYYDWGFYRAKNRLHYLSLPVLLRARLQPSSSDASLYVLAGPRVDILVAKEPDPWFESIYDDLATLGFGVDLGVGLEVGKGRLEFIHSETFTDSRPDDDLFIIKNRAQSIVYGILLPPIPRPRKSRVESLSGSGSP